MTKSDKKERKKERPEVAPAVIMLVEGLRDDEISDILIREYSLSKKSAGEVVERAREKITIASSSNLRDEISLAKVQLEDIYRKAIDDGQLKIALSARVERNRLLNLYDSDDLSVISGALQDERERLIRDNLEPLILHLNLIENPPDVPLEELVRIVVAHVWETL